MTISVRYIITDANGNLIDWYNRTGVAALDIFGKEAQVFGSGEADGVYVQAGTSANLTELSAGNDKIYLSGNLSDYSQSIDQGTGVYTLTRVAGFVQGQTEIITFTVGGDDDVLYFADGHISLNVASNPDIFDLNTGEFKQIVQGALQAGGTPVTPSEVGASTTSIAPINVFVDDANGISVPQAMQTGQKLKVYGSGEADSVYVRKGTSVDATELSAGNDLVYLTGNLADYTQSIDQGTGVYTLTRTTGLEASLVEVVTFTVGGDDDVLYFADGSIVLNVATNPDIFDLNTGEFKFITQAALQAATTPGLSDIQAITVDVANSSGAQGGWYNEGDAIVFTVTMKSAVDVVITNGVPRLKVALDSGATVWAMYDSTLTGGDTNKTELKFKYMVGGTDTDSNGVGVVKGNDSTSALDLNSGAIYKAGTTTGVKLTQSPALADQGDHKVDNTAPVLNLTALTDNQLTSAQAAAYEQSYSVVETGSGMASTTAVVKSGDTVQSGVTLSTTGGKVVGNLSSLSDGTYTIEVTSADNAGNIHVQTQSVIVDKTAPIRIAGTTGTISTITNLALTFDSEVSVNTGNIVIYKSNGDVFETISVTETDKVTFSADKKTVVINPSKDLVAGEAYYAQFAAGAFRDAAGNPSAGITNTTDWAFNVIKLWTTVTVANNAAADALISAPELSSLSISGVLGNVGNVVTGVTISSIVFTATDGSGSVTIDSGLPVLSSSADGTPWTANLSSPALVHGKGYTVAVNLTGTATGNAIIGSGIVGSAGSPAFTVNTAGPVVMDENISLTGAATGTGGAYKVGDTVTAVYDPTGNSDLSTVTVDFSQFGGGTAVAASLQTSGVNSGKWVASYTIVEGLIDATNCNVSVTATNALGNPTTTADTTGVSVDNQAPVLTDANISISGATGTGGAYKVGDTVTAVYDPTGNSDLSTVTVDFSQFGGGIAVAASLQTSGVNSGKWVASYTIVEGLIDATNRNVSVTVSDDAGYAPVTAADTTGATVDNTLTPTVSIVALSAEDGVTDFVTKTASQTITATLGRALTGAEKLYGTLDGTNWTDITNFVSGTSVTWSGAVLSVGNKTLQFRTEDAAGNKAVATQSYALLTRAAFSTSAESNMPVGNSNTLTSYRYVYLYVEAKGGRRFDMSELQVLDVNGKNVSAGLLAKAGGGFASFSTAGLTNGVTDGGTDFGTDKNGGWFTSDGWVILDLGQSVAVGHVRFVGAGTWQASRSDGAMIYLSNTNIATPSLTNLSTSAVKIATTSGGVANVALNQVSYVPTDDTTPTINGTLDASLPANYQVAIYNNGIFVGNAGVTNSANSATWEYTFANGQAVFGKNQIEARVLDSVGNTFLSVTGSNFTLIGNEVTVTGSSESGMNVGNLDTLAIKHRYVYLFVEAKGGRRFDMSELQVLDVNGKNVSAGLLAKAGGGFASFSTAGLTNGVTDGGTDFGTDKNGGWFTSDGWVILDLGQSVAVGHVRFVGAGTWQASRSDGAMIYLSNTNIATPSLTNLSTSAVKIATTSGGVANVALNQVSYVPTDDTTPTINGTLSNALSTDFKLSVYNGSTYLGDATVTNTSWTFTVPAGSALATGIVHNLTARILRKSDSEVMVSSGTYTVQVNTAVPTQTVTITSVTDNVNTNGSTATTLINGGSTDDVTPTISGTISAGLADLQVLVVYTTVNGVESKLGNASVNGTNWTYTHSSDLSAGAHSLSARVEFSNSGVAGVSSAAYALNIHGGLSFTLSDAVGGQQGAVASGGSTDDGRPALSGKLLVGLGPGEELAVYDTVNGINTKLGVATFVGQDWSFRPDTALGEGGHNLKVMVQPVGDSTGTAGRVVSTTTSIAVDFTAPVLQGALLSSDGTQLVLTYDEALNASTVAKEAFVVVVGGSAAVINSVEVSGNTVVLTLATAVLGSQSVTVSYSDPTMGADDVNAIQDQAGNDATSFTEIAVLKPLVLVAAGATDAATDNTLSDGGAGEILTLVNLGLNDVQVASAQNITFTSLTNLRLYSLSTAGDASSTATEITALAGAVLTRADIEAGKYLLKYGQEDEATAGRNAFGTYKVFDGSRTYVRGLDVVMSKVNGSVVWGDESGMGGQGTNSNTDSLGNGGAGAGGADVLLGTLGADLVFGDGSGGGAGDATYYTADNGVYSGGAAGGGDDLIAASSGFDIIFGDGFAGDSVGAWIRDGGAGGYGGGGGGGAGMYDNLLGVGGAAGVGAGVGASTSTVSPFAGAGGASYLGAVTTGGVQIGNTSRNTHGGGGAGVSADANAIVSESYIAELNSANVALTVQAVRAAFLDGLGGSNTDDRMFIQTMGGGSDVIYGGSGNDYIMAGQGDDTIVGGQGNDIVYGRGGGILTMPLTDNDTFVWQRGDAGYSGAFDIVRDFTVWDGNRGDRLNIRELLEGYTLGSSDLSLWVTVQIGVIGASFLEKEEVIVDSWDVRQTGTLLSIDVDGQGSGSVTQRIFLVDAVFNTDPFNLYTKGILDF